MTSHRKLALRPPPDDDIENELGGVPGFEPIEPDVPLDVIEIEPDSNQPDFEPDSHCRVEVDCQ